MAEMMTITPAAALKELRGMDLPPGEYLAVLERAARRRALGQYGDDPVGWCNRCAWGKDYEARPPVEYKVTLRDWQADLLAVLLAGQGGEPQRHVILKSRGVGASWAAIWYATWLLWARAPAQVLLMSDTEAKAWDLMRRHRFVTEKLPPELGYPRPPAGSADNLSTRILPNGSEIHSLSGNPDAIHTYHPSLIVVDEAAYLREDPRAALIGTKADILVMSTANGWGGAFHELWEDSYHQGAEEWGFAPRFVSWRDRPDLTERPKGSLAIVQQEYPETPEEAFVASTVNLHRLDDDQLLEPFVIPAKWPVMAVHDPGVDTGGWVWLARVCGDKHGPMRDGDIYACEEWDPAGSSISEQVTEAKKRARRLRVVQSVIDPSSHTRTHGGDRWLRVADLFSERGIHFSDGSNDVAAGVAGIADALEGRRLWISQRCTGLIQDVRTVTLDNKDEKHYYACLRYGMLASPGRMMGLVDPIPPPKNFQEAQARHRARQIERMKRGDEDTDYDDAE